MGGQAELPQDLTHLVVVVALRQTHPLWLLLSRLGTVDDDAFNGRTHQFHIVAIGPLNHQTDWQTMPLGEQAALDPALAPIGVIRAGFFYDGNLTRSNAKKLLRFQPSWRRTVGAQSVTSSHQRQTLRAASTLHLGAN